MGKDGTQLLRHCVRLLVLVSTDLVAVRSSGIGLLYACHIFFIIHSVLAWRVGIFCLYVHFSWLFHKVVCDE